MFQRTESFRTIVLHPAEIKLTFTLSKLYVKQEDNKDIGGKVKQKRQKGKNGRKKIFDFRITSL